MKDSEISSSYKGNVSEASSQAMDYSEELTVAKATKILRKHKYGVHIMRFKDFSVTVVLILNAISSL